MRNRESKDMEHGMLLGAGLLAASFITTRLLKSLFQSRRPVKGADDAQA